MWPEDESKAVHATAAVSSSEVSRVCGQTEASESLEWVGAFRAEGPGVDVKREGMRRSVLLPLCMGRSKAAKVTGTSEGKPLRHI